MEIDTRPVYAFTVNIRGVTLEQARKVIAERINFDEDYGFPYQIDYEGWEEA